MENWFNKKKILISIAIFLFVLIITWTTSFHLAEWWSYFDSLYFAVMTFTTIWYWDFAPITDVWKAFAIIYAILWVPIFVGLLTIIVESRIKMLIHDYFVHHTKKLVHTDNQLKKELSKEEQEISTIEKEVNKMKNDMKTKKTWIFKKMLKKIKLKK